MSEQLLHTPLHEWHLARGGRMAGFAGYDMPIRYDAGTIAEHVQTRTSAGLFDVSHMGPIELRADGGFAHIADELELLVPCDVAGLGVGRQRYTQLLADDGGIIDDLMITRIDYDHPGSDSTLTIVSNADRKHIVADHLRSRLADSIEVRPIADRALLALQGPAAEAVLAGLVADPDALGSTVFLDARHVEVLGQLMIASRSGYTGEDGFELMLPADVAVAVADALIADPRVGPVGLGARDTLRLEAGLCLYGNDIDLTTSPIEAGLTWSIQKRRRADLRFPGSSRIAAELADGPRRLRVGLRPEGRQPVRAHAALHATPDASDSAVGEVSSGSFGPTIGGPVAIGYVPPALATPGTTVYAVGRGEPQAMTVAALPFVPNTFRR